MKNLPNLPVACCLTTGELRDRQATLLAQFRSAVLETEELEEGYAFRLSGDRPQRHKGILENDPMQGE